MSIEGRPHVGLLLKGPELGSRNLILRHAYHAAYDTFLIGREFGKAFGDTADEFGFDDALRANLLRYFTVMLDRTVNGHWLLDTPAAYSDIQGTQAHAYAASRAARVARLIDEEIPRNPLPAHHS